MNLIVRGAVWFGVYLFLVLFPLVVAAVADPIEVPRPFLVEVGVALGAVGLSIMVFQFALVSRTRAAAAAFGEDALLQFHILLGGLAVNYRLVRPLRMLRRPWEVTRNVAERGGARTLVLRPVGHAGMAFQPGQFAWLITGPTPFALEQHPLSFSSSAETAPGGEVAFTIKAAGDWSSQTVPTLQPGRRVWVDGPYGVFSVDREEGPGYVLVAGGSGSRRWAPCS